MFYDPIGWPSGQRRTHRENFGKEAQSRSPIVALFDTVSTQPMRDRAFVWQWEDRQYRKQVGNRVSYTGQEQRSSDIRVSICVGLELWHTTRCPDLDKAIAYAESYIHHNIQRHTEQMTLLEMAV